MFQRIALLKERVRKLDDAMYAFEQAHPNTRYWEDARYDFMHTMLARYNTELAQLNSR